MAIIKRLFRWKYSIVGIAVLLVLLYIGVGVARGRALVPIQPYTIILTENGFSPKTITIPVGATVEFRSTGVPFWPASNYHPTHGLYPEFDAKEVIAATSSWHFRFDFPGDWGFHDHLRPQMTGLIRVAQPFSFLPALDICETMSGDPDRNPRIVQCWQSRIARTLREKGLDGAFDLFARFYEQEKGFASHCHDISHLLGEAAYTQYDRSGTIHLTGKTAYCGYGFYHGFIEALLRAGRSLGDARAICDTVQEEMSQTVRSPQARTACYHGFGHGAFDATSTADYSDEGDLVAAALARCEAFVPGKTDTEKELLRLCTTGVFNALANAYLAKNSFLAFRRSDPFWICRRQVTSYQKGCVMEIGVSYIRDQGYERDRAIPFIRGGGSYENVAALFMAYAADEMRAHIQTVTVDEAGKLCDAVPGIYQSSCREGVAYGLLASGKPGEEYKKSIAFCASLTEQARDSCYAYIVPLIAGVYTKEKAIEICKTLPPVYQRYCTYPL